MLSKNNQGLQQQKLAAQRQHFGLRKLNVGVASVLLGASLLWWAGAKPARAADNVTPNQSAASAASPNDLSINKVVTLPKSSKSVNNQSANATETSGRSQETNQQEKVATSTAPTDGLQNGSADQVVPTVPGKSTTAGQVPDPTNDKNPLINDSTTKVVDATPTTITGTYTEGSNGQETVTIPGASLSIDHNMLDRLHDPNSGQINLTFNINSAKAGDTFVITVPTDYGCNPAGISGTPNVKVSGPDWGRYTITVLADITGTSTVTLTTKIIESDNSYGAASSPIEKLGTVVEAITLTKNGVPVDQSLHFTYVTDPAATIRVNPITSPSTNNGAVVPGVDNVYTFTINGAAGMVVNDLYPSSWVYSGSNYGSTVTIPVPKGFILNQELTNLLNPGPYYGTISQAGVGSDIVVTVPKGTGTQFYNYKPGLRLVGRFDVTATDQNQTITADGNPTLEQNILYTNADGSTTMKTVTKETTPWTVTILGSQVPLQNNSGVNVWGAQGNNQLVLNPQATTDPNPDVLNKVSITNASGLSFDNTNLPADQQAQITITIPDGLTINKIATPKDDVNFPNLPGTTSYDYVLTLADGQTIKGTVTAGEAVTTPGAAITRAVFTPNFLASFATMNGDVSFQLFGKLANQKADGQPVKSGDKLTTTAKFSFNYEGKSYVKSADKQQTVSGVTIGFSLGGNFQNPWVSNQPGTGNYVGIYGSSQGNYGYTYEPVFYYVLPTDVYANLNYNDIRANFANGAVIGSADGKVLPTLSTYEVNGHQVVKIDYTGTGISVPTGGNAYNTLNYTINPDALPGVYSGDQGGQIYVISPQNLLVGNNAELAATPDQINTYLQGNPSGKNAYFLGNFSLTVNSGQALGVNELSQGNDDPVSVGNATATDKNRPDMEIDFNLVNTANSTTGEKMVAVENVPVKDDQYGNQFNFTMTGPAEYEPAQGSIPEGDIQFLYSTTACPEPNGQQVGAMPDLTGYVTADQVTDWSAIKAVAEIIPNGLAVNTMAGRVVLHGKDLTQLTDAGKKIYAQAIFFRSDGLPVVNSVKTHPDITNITVVGNSTVNVALQYQYNGQTVTVNVPVLAKTYQDNVSTMDESDFTNLNHDAIVQALIANGVPAAVAQYFIQNADPASLTIMNGTNASWKANWPDAANGTAAFGQKVQYYFDGDTVVVKLVHQTQDVAPEAKTVTRTINVKDPVTGKVTTTNQTANFHRTATKDLVTGDVIYGAWSADQKWAAFTTPLIAGYTPSQTNVAEQIVSGNDKDVTINIYYTANDETVNVIFKDKQGNQIGKDTLTGKMNGTVDTKSANVPSGWQVVGIDPRGEVKLGLNNPDIVVTVDHGTQDVTATDPNATKTVTRTINVTDPVTGKVTMTTQTANFNRTATKDLVTGDVTYGGWNEASHNFDSVTVPTIPGYTPSGDVPELTVTPESGDSTVTITYTANDQTASLTIIDDTTGQTLATDSTKGKFGQAVSFPDLAGQLAQYEKDGYVIVSNSLDGQTYQADNAKNAFTVHLEHGTQDVSKSDPDATKTVTRTINVTDPVTGKVTTTTQTANFHRTATKDLVTNKVTYGDWNTGQKWAAFTTPTIAGYTPSQTSVAGKDVTADDKDQTIDITYTADPESVNVIFKDKQGNRIGKTQTVTGVMNGTVNTTTTTVPAGWVIVGQDPRTTDYKLGTKNPDIVVTIAHGTKQLADDTKTVTRTIVVALPDGTKQTVSQTATFTRTVSEDLVTGAKTYGKWSADQTWAAFTPDQIAGYVATPAGVPAQRVTPDTADTTVTVTYAPVGGTNQAPSQDASAVPSQAPGEGSSTTPTPGKGTRTTPAGLTKPATKAPAAAQKRLPQTGNADRKAPALAGIALLGVAASLLGVGKRRKHEE